MFIFIVLFAVCCSPLHSEPYSEKSEGSFEGWIYKRQELLSLFLPLDPVILEAGAHYGNETLLFLNHWPYSQVISFEPNPHAFEVLSTITSPFRNIDIYPLALNDKPGVLPFYLCYGTDGNRSNFEHASSLLKPSPEMQIHYQGPIIRVTGVNLDDWCKSNGVDHIDLLRLDLQGSELQVLKSSPAILSTVTAILIETHLFPFRIETTQYQDLKEFLEEKGFRLISHWFREGLGGNAIFIKNDFFSEFSAAKIIEDDWKANCREDRISHIPFLHANFFIDDSARSMPDLLKGDYESAEEFNEMMETFTQEGSIAIDGGAQVGVHTIALSRKVGPKGAVLAFEPNEKNYLKLLLNLKLNNCTNVIPICKGLWNSAGSFQLAPDKIGEGSGFTKMIPLDNLDLKNLSLILLDVENDPLPILQGARKNILINTPVIIIEPRIQKSPIKLTHQKREELYNIISFVESNGYEIYASHLNTLIALPKDKYIKWSDFKNSLRPLKKHSWNLGL